jgi:1,4-alpha-glucan branching enzyme
MPTPTRPRGYLAIILHAHLPYVRHPEHERFLEESWFFEAATETYLPLLQVLDDLVAGEVDFRLSISLSPTLLSMFDDELLRERLDRHLAALEELSEREVARLRRDAVLREVAAFYHERFRILRRLYNAGYGRDLTAAFRRLQDLGRVEVLAGPATHAYLPLLCREPASARAQVAVGVDHYRRVFGREPQGFWLPECGYSRGLDAVLGEQGLRYFCVEAHGLLRGSTRLRYGLYAPVVCPSGVAAFARDPESARQVWSREDGFPGDPAYREFHRDVGFELPAELLGPYFAADGHRAPTGLKYYRVTGKGERKQAYVRKQALARTAEHAREFLAQRCEQVEWLAPRMDRTPLVVAPYDAELFGHWWFEGPEWLDGLLRDIAREPETQPPALRTVTLSSYLAEYPEGQVVEPCESSWGQGGYHEVWLDRTNDWVYPLLYRAARRMARLAAAPSAGRRRRALQQAGRELLLAQSSDWTFHQKTGSARDYARRRADEHLKNFFTLTRTLDTRTSEETATLDEDLLAMLEAKDNIFPDLDVKLFAGGAPASLLAGAVPGSPSHVAFLTAELAPLVKVGGLADVAGALPQALTRFGVWVTVVLPAYGTIDRGKHRLRPLRRDLEVQVGAEKQRFHVLEVWPPQPGVRWLLIDCEPYFGREGVYVEPVTKAEYEDTAERFAFFGRAALESLRVLGEPVDVVHCHDYHTAPAVVLLKREMRGDPVLGRAASVFTIHNLAHQGLCGPEALDLIGVPRSECRPGSDFEYYGKVNWMKLGITHADKVSTVSRTYAREICEDPVQSAGLGGVLAARRGDLFGIANGIDTAEWDPARDKHLPAPYDAKDLSGKREAKRVLLEKVGLAASALDAPLVGIIGRLVNQKGLDLVQEGLEDVLALGANLVVLGTGLEEFEVFLREAESEHPGRVAAKILFDNALAHLIEAGVDLFLMPSHYEPCGLNQLYSLRYGTIPVVRETGGLVDTVRDADAHADGFGFSFQPYEAGAMLDALERAVRAYRDPPRWQGIIQRAMARQHGWGVSALEYLAMYREAMRSRAAG